MQPQPCRPGSPLPATVPAAGPPLLYWRPVAVAGVLTLSVVVTLTVAVRSSGRPAETRKVLAPAASLSPAPVAARPEPKPLPPLPPVEDPVPPAPVPVALPPAAADVAEPAPACAPRDTYGTRVEFVNNLTEAAREARRQGKLKFVLHVSGNFEDARFT